ncbi:tubulin nucleotide-binding domain-like protein [Echria macrotheca]|uniref:Tubulin nucleotide-binding domain-like protein n=1 Tax=Echria macrotheca TaxID=438768 RepID=A0AAJ0F886_9PEZI|nr:tubulin nucleotide-binding domain-like protein [Echria macrotheca]
MTSKIKMHEIITLQFGQQSNYLATHFWNTQESYFTYAEEGQTQAEESAVDHDVHWRPGLAADGMTETFMPRTVIYDLKGGFGSLRRINALYAGEDKVEALWNGPTAKTQTAPPIAPSAYQAALESGMAPPAEALTPSTVRFWSDYNRVYLHPRSSVQLSEFELDSALNPFDRFTVGEELFTSLDREHDLLDRDLRLFAEEADQMQGIQVFGGLDDAWGGFGARYLERIRDEYGKTAVWMWGMEGDGGGSREKRLLRLSNQARTLVEAYKQATLVIPLSTPSRVSSSSTPSHLSVSLDRSVPWHTTALLASAIESATLPSRLKDASQRDTLSDMAVALSSGPGRSAGKQTIASLEMDFPTLPTGSTMTDQDQEDEREDPKSLPIKFTPSHPQIDMLPARRKQSHKEVKTFSQLLSTRGYPPPSSRNQSQGEEETDSRTHNHVSRARRNPYDTFTKRYHTPLTFPMLDSFPPIFHHQSASNQDGNGSGTTNPPQNVAITTRLSTDSSTSTRLNLLRTTVARSIGLEDREGLAADLADMADEFHEGWSSGSDEGDDD